MWAWLKNIMMRMRGRRADDDFGQRLVDGYGLHRD